MAVRLLSVVIGTTLISIVHSTATFNAALGKDASQSSVYIAGIGGLTAENAVDGTVDPVFRNCACTAHSDYNAWWQVDLGGNYHVISVIVTNRLTYSNRLRDFTVTISHDDDNPGIVCGLYSGVVPSAATVTVSCDKLTWGRYVKITKPVTSDYDILTLCEVQVISIKRSYIIFKRLIGKNATTDNTVTMAANLQTCAHACKDSDYCLAINHNRDMNTCQLFNTTDTMDAGVNDGWAFFVLVL